MAWAPSQWVVEAVGVMIYYPWSEVRTAGSFGGENRAKTPLA